MSLKLKFNLLFKFGLISLGLAVPSSFSVLIVNSFCTGLVNSIIFKKKKFRLLSLILLLSLVWLISIKNHWAIHGVFLSWLLIITGYLMGSFIKDNLRPWVLLFFLSLGYLLVAFFDGRPVRQIVKQEPIFDHYTTDMKGYLKTYFLIEKGMPFYQAYAIGEKGDAFVDSYPGEIWGWKTPFLFYLWKIFPGQDGRTIYWLFVTLILSIPLFSYLIAKQLVGNNLASLSPFLIWPYFLLPLKEMTFIQVEWWGLIFFLLGFYFLLNNRIFWAGLFFTLTLFSRELLAVHLFFLGAVLLLSGSKKAIRSIFAPFLLIFLFYILIHIPNIKNYENLSILDSWWRKGGATVAWHNVRNTLAFNSWQYLLFNFFPFRISLIFSLLGLVFLYMRRKIKKYLLSMASFLPFFLFQFKPGIMGLQHDYWGIYYVPLTLLFLPTAVKVFKLRKEDK